MLADDSFEAIQAFAKAGTDGFWVQIERMADFVIAQIGEITQFNDLAAGRIQLIEGAMQLRDLFGGHELGIRTGRGGWRIEREAVLGVFGIERKGGLAATAFGGGTALAVIAGFVCGDAKEPGLKLAAAMKGIEILDNGQENFLADFLGIFPREIRCKLENESGGGGIMEVE